MNILIKMRGLLLLIILLLGSNSVDAQKVIVKGIVKDSISHAGEPYASICIFKESQTEKPFAMFVSDKEGVFKQSISAARGNYVLQISSVGRKDVKRFFSLKGEADKDLGTFYIADDVKNLKNVTVTAQKPLVKMEVDKMSYSVENDVDAKSNSALDILRKVPMVNVDGNDRITVNGSSSFKVYVDGKPNVMLSSNPGMILKNMPASAIKNIEVVTNPGAKYDAEGVGGVLNIIMNKTNAKDKAAMNNLSATLRATASNWGLGGSVYAAVQQGKLSMSVNASVGRNKMKDSRMSSVRDQVETSGTTSSVDMNQSSDMTNTYKMGDLNMSYEIDSLRLVSGSVGVMSFGNDVDALGRTAMTGTYGSNTFGYQTNNNTNLKYNTFNANVDYQRTFAGHKDRVFTLSYLISTTPNKNRMLNRFITDDSSTALNLDDRYSDVRNKTVEHTFQADYSSPMGKFLSLDAGAKYILRNNTSNSDYYKVVGDDKTFDPNSSLNYKHGNDILAGYAEMKATVKALTMKAGLRYEHTWQNVKYLSEQGKDFRLDYGNLVPSGNLSYKISDSQNIGLAYNMRISRPSIDMLNPYVDKSDPTALSYGNTDLECEKSHNINMVYNYFTMKWMMNLTLRHTIVDNAIERYSFYENNVLNSTYGNVVKNHQTGLNAYINWTLGKNTRLMLNGGLSYVDLKSAVLQLSNNGWQANAMLGLQQTLPWKIRMSLNAICNTKQYNLQGSSSGFNLLIASLTRSFCKDKLNASVSFMTPMSGSRLEMNTYSKGSNYVNRSNNSFCMRNISFSLSYTIGGHKEVKKARHTITNDDLKKVQNQNESIGTMVQ
jgi:hypothetical protein